MTLTVARLTGWAPGSLPGAADDLLATAEQLDDLERGVDQAVAQMVWSSPAGDAARAAAADLGLALRALREAFDMQGQAVRNAGTAIEAAQDLLVCAQRVAGDHGLTVLPDGEVTAPPPVMTAADPSPAEQARIADQRDAALEARDRARAMARESLAAAREADAAAAEALQQSDSIGVLLSRVAPGVGGVLGSTVWMASYAAAVREGLLDDIGDRPLPAAGTDPRRVSAWWESLPDGVQRSLLAASPELLGNLDGMPAAVRDAANRMALTGYRAALEAEVARLERALDDRWFGGTFTDDDAALDYARGKLEALDRIEEVAAYPDRYLLVLDPSGEQLKAAVAVGNVDSAAHVAVFAGGLGSTVQDSLVGYDNQMWALREQAALLSLRAGTGSVAAVTWLGYEAPQVSDTWRPSRSVAGQEGAERGAERLSAFYNGLDAARTDAAHLTALGHSYGSLTTGLALQRGTGVDDAVFFGSPGLGTSDVTDLGLRPGRVYVSEARNDAVADLAVFGSDPNQIDGVVGLSAAQSIIDNVTRQESTGHSSYLAEDSTSQYGIAAVVAGQPDRVPQDSGFGLGDVLQWEP